MQALGWIRITVGLVGVAGLLLSAVCFLAAQVIFGTDAFRTLTRVPIGLLGAESFGIGAMAIVAALEGDILALQFAARTLFLAAALVPVVSTTTSAPSTRSTPPDRGRSYCPHLSSSA